MRSSETYVAIGNFDGVHRGHATVVESCVSAAADRGLAPTLLTFDPHPAVVLGRAAPPTLTRVERKVQLFSERWPELRVVVMPFNAELASLGPAEFAQRVLVEQLNAKAVVVGENFRFGRGRAGDLQLLERLGAQFGFEARALPLFADGAGPISSSRIRAAVGAGELRLAGELLGRPHAVSGEVVVGDQRGRLLGFPTANLAAVFEALPPHGVYCGWASVLDEGLEVSRHGFVANFGVRPTFSAGPSIEAHFLEFSGDLYGRRVRLELLDRLRPEQRFAGVEALVAQLHTDVAEARRLLAAAR